MRKSLTRPGAPSLFSWQTPPWSAVVVRVCVACVVATSACQRANPAYHPDAAGAAGGPGTGGAIGNGGNAATGGTVGTGGIIATSGGTTGGGGTSSGGAGGDASASGGMNGGGGAGGRAPDGGIPDGMPDGRGDGPDGMNGLCQDPTDCQGQLGAPACGVWECKSGMCALDCPNCTDKDGDGYGVGAGCAGLDCDDADAQVTGAGSRSCFTGAAASKNVGVCRAGTETCVAGTWSTCTGQVLPSGEACNGEDDDCNGAVDDKLAPIACGVGACARQVAACSSGKVAQCLPAAPTATTDGCDGIDNDCDGIADEDCTTVTCVHVAPGGDDTTADGITKAFRNLQPAIAWAIAQPDHPKRVCVAGGATCQDRATFVSPDALPGLIMANGISVFGNYEATGWTRCPLGAPQMSSGGPTVTIQTQTATGVVFPAAVTTPTILDGFAFARSRGDALASTAAITVDGAKQVTLSNLVIADAPVALATWGINLINGAQALIMRSNVSAGSGSSEAIAIRSNGASPTIRENCSKLDPNTGRCATTSCTGGPGLRGRDNTGASTTTGPSAVIFLKDSPGAIVESNAICGGPATELAGVRVAGAAAGTVVRGNSILAVGGTTESDGVWLDACNDAAPWIVDNEVIAADGAAGASVAAVRALGSCHPVIDTNQNLAAGGDAATARATGVLCGGSGTSASRCAVLGNKLIQGASSGHPLSSMGISCEGGACVRIAGNNIDARGGGDTVGLSVTGGGPLIERNSIAGGCAIKTAIGLRLDNGSGRVQNNLVRGAVCDGNQAPAESLGLRVFVQPGGNEPDVHSNTIDGAGSGTCVGAAVAFGTTAVTAGIVAAPINKGIFRNNILSAGACKTIRYDFWEDAPMANPRLFENNDLDPTGSPTALYLEGSLTPQNTAAAVNGLTSTSASGNISAAPMFVAPPADLHLGMGSACVNAGTAAGAPPTDFGGKARDAKPDIGAFEQ